MVVLPGRETSPALLKKGNSMVFCQLFYPVSVGSVFFPRLRPIRVVGGQYYHYWAKYPPPLTLHVGDDFYHLNRSLTDDAGEIHLAGILLDENPYSFC